MGSQVVGLLGGWRPTPLSPPTSASTCWARRHVVVLVCRLAVLRLCEPCTLRFSCSRHARQSSAQLVVLITSFRRRIWLDAPAAVATADDCLRRRSLRKRSTTSEPKRGNTDAAKPQLLLPCCAACFAFFLWLP